MKREDEEEGAMDGPKRVREKAIAVFGTPQAAAVWLSNTQPSLAGRVPLELIATDAGVCEVLRVLNLSDYGDPI